MINECVSSKIILILIVCLLFLTLFIIIPLFFVVFATNMQVFVDFSTMAGGFGTCLGAFLSFISICLVIYTIREQNKTWKDESQDRKESEFISELIHMLCNMGDVVDSISIYRRYISDNCIEKECVYSKIDAFRMANNDIRAIYECLKASEYKQYSSSILDDFDGIFTELHRQLEVYNSIETECNYIKSELKVNLSEINQRYKCHVYGISNEVWLECRNLNNEEQWKKATQIFWKVNGRHFWKYVRIALCISLCFNEFMAVSKIDKTRKKQINRIILSHMSSDEITFIKHLIRYKYDDLKIFVGAKEE